jgi:hypothetical protein
MACLKGVTLAHGLRCRELLTPCQDNWSPSHNSNWKFPDYKKDVIKQKQGTKVNEE